MPCDICYEEGCTGMDEGLCPCRSRCHDAEARGKELFKRSVEALKGLLGRCEVLVKEGSGIACLVRPGLAPDKMCPQCKAWALVKELQDAGLWPKER